MKLEKDRLLPYVCSIIKFHIKSEIIVISRPRVCVPSYTLTCYAPLLICSHALHQWFSTYSRLRAPPQKMSAIFCHFFDY